MAIIKEFYKTRIDGVNLYRSYSDLGLRIHKVGTDEIYDEAIDVENSGFEYEETEIPNEEITDSDFLELVETTLL